MPPWLRRLRGTFGTGLVWAFIWALGGVAVGVLSLVTPWLPWDRVFAIWDAPLPALALPGFVGGICFSLVLGVLGRRVRFAELTTGRMAAWGALGGVLLSLIPPALVLTGLATLGRPDASLLWLTLVTGVPFTGFAAVSAVDSLLLARRTAGVALPAPSASGAPPGP